MGNWSATLLTGKWTNVFMLAKGMFSPYKRASQEAKLLQSLGEQLKLLRDVSYVP